MKKLMFNTLLTLSIGLFAQQALAQVEITTGVPGGSNQLSLNGANWLAEAFTTTETLNITSLAGYINADSSQIGNTFTLSVYDNSSAGTPWLASQEFTQTATFGGDGWNGVSGISGLQLAAGTYWLAFEIGINDYFDGFMQTTSTSPLAFANYDGVNTWGYSLVTGSNIATQVIANPVPEPALFWLLVSGMAVMSRAVKRQAA